MESRVPNVLSYGKSFRTFLGLETIATFRIVKGFEVDYYDALTDVG